MSHLWNEQLTQLPKRSTIKTQHNGSLFSVEEESNSKYIHSKSPKKQIIESISIVNASNDNIENDPNTGNQQERIKVNSAHYSKPNRFSNNFEEREESIDYMEPANTNEYDKIETLKYPNPKRKAKNKNANYWRVKQLREKKRQIKHKSMQESKMSRVTSIEEKMFDMNKKTSDKKKGDLFIQNLNQNILFQKMMSPGVSRMQSPKQTHGMDVENSVQSQVKRQLGNLNLIEKKASKKNTYSRGNLNEYTSSKKKKNLLNSAPGTKMIKTTDNWKNYNNEDMSVFTSTGKSINSKSTKKSKSKRRQKPGKKTKHKRSKTDYLLSKKFNFDEALNMKNFDDIYLDKDFQKLSQDSRKLTFKKKKKDLL